MSNSYTFNFVKPGVFNLPEIDWWGFDPEEGFIEIQPHWTMAHIAVEMGVFPSVSIAKKNGWSGPIPIGYSCRHGIGKYNKYYHIHNPPDEFISNSEYGKYDVPPEEPSQDS